MKRRKAKNKELIIGVSGNFGSGKTTVAKAFKYLGAEVIDADKIAHTVILKTSPAYRRIVKSFGHSILKQDKEIDRRKLAQLAFARRAMLEKLNRITHPEIIRIMKTRIDKARAKTIVLDAPLLIEAGLYNFVDKLIVVKISRVLQLKRLKASTGLRKKEILARIKSQIPLAKKVRLADFVIDNNGTVEETKKQAKKIMKQLSLASDL
ncbi:MAG: dephospho-CoA kinase [Candidatus Omnitrophota bacterium]